MGATTKVRWGQGRRSIAASSQRFQTPPAGARQMTSNPVHHNVTTVTQAFGMGMGVVHGHPSIQIHDEDRPPVNTGSQGLASRESLRQRVTVDDPNSWLNRHEKGDQSGEWTMVQLGMQVMFDYHQLVVDDTWNSQDT